MRLPKPAPTSLAQCVESHCVELGQGRSICKCLPQQDEAPSHLILFESGKEIQRWRADSYVRRTYDFEVMSGDLRGDGKPLWIVANHELSSQGMLMRFWSLHILDPVEPAKPPISWTVLDYGPGTFALPRSREEKGCDILVTDWLEGQDSKGKAELYFLGAWHRLGTNDITRLSTRKDRLRRYLHAFERERRSLEDRDGIDYLKGFPALWLRPGKAVHYDPRQTILRLNTGPVPAP